MICISIYIKETCLCVHDATKLGSGKTLIKIHADKKLYLIYIPYFVQKRNSKCLKFLFFLPQNNLYLVIFTYSPFFFDFYFPRGNKINTINQIEAYLTLNFITHPKVQLCIQHVIYQIKKARNDELLLHDGLILVYFSIKP